MIDLNVIINETEHKAWLPSGSQARNFGVLIFFVNCKIFTDMYSIIMGKNTEAGECSSMHKRQIMFELMNRI